MSYNYEPSKKSQPVLLG